MSPFDSLDAFLISASTAFCSPLAIFVQIQGYVICLTLAIGWAFSAYVRSREIRRMKAHMKGGNSFAFLSHDINDLEHSNQVNLPRVTVVMPLKGFGEHNLHNWRSQITSLYGGPLEFHFVVESTEDPAYHAINRLLADYEDDVDAKLIVAGLSTTCSQKIHNQLIGVERMHKDCKYILFLDDDVRLHPGSIGALTAEMEKNPEIFIQTGYPLDLPSGSLGSYCIYEYHMPCSMGFATGGKTFFLWGGCMMMHADDFRNDRHGVVSELRDGGYSDDMTLAAIAGAHKRLITSPPVAVFPHPLASDLSFSRYWNYLSKQTFVLESYTTKVNWIMNRALFSSHCYLSWGFVAPYIMAVVHVAAALRIHSKGHSLGDATLSSCGKNITFIRVTEHLGNMERGSPTKRLKSKGKAGVDYDAFHFTGQNEKKLFNKVWVRNGAVLERKLNLVALENIGIRFVQNFTSRGLVNLKKFKANSVLTLCQEFMANIKHESKSEQGKEKLCSWVRGKKLRVTPDTFAEIFEIPREENLEFAFPNTGMSDLAGVTEHLGNMEHGSPTKRSKSKGKTGVDYDTSHFTGQNEEKLFNKVWVRNGAVLERKLNLVALENTGIRIGDLRLKKTLVETLVLHGYTNIVVCICIVLIETYGVTEHLGNMERGSPTKRLKSKGKAGVDYDAFYFTRQNEEKLFNKVWVRNGAILERKLNLVGLENTGIRFVQNFTTWGWVNLTKFKADSVLTLCQEFMANIKHEPEN
ncbi:uncharacterized protein LOC130790315 [Actinidia eriantha]|uniref:uncharacterized protein LOC130790315 n=1 Tax=Actinidia eriantha TaxID=165200 RepID=UPI00258FBA43|nr:uncharacterized protein LOC130790315 [Actinidia eriantha]